MIFLLCSFFSKFFGLKIPFTNFESILVKSKHLFILSNNRAILIDRIFLSLFLDLNSPEYRLIIGQGSILSLSISQNSQVYCGMVLITDILQRNDGLLFVHIVLRLKSFKSMFQALHL